MLGLLISVSVAASADASAALSSARKLADALRYEEAVVEYQRYLGTAQDAPARERAAALFELGFIHLVLGDEVNAQARATDALELDAGLSLPSTAPARQVDFLAEVKRQFLTRTRVTVEQGDGPQGLRARLVDPQKRVKRVLLRHALASNGPFYSVEMRCLGDECKAELPAPQQGGDFTAWYYIEALDEKNVTVATASDARAPRQLAVIGGRPWYQSPITWGIAGGALVAVGIVVYLLSPPPPR